MSPKIFLRTLALVSSALACGAPQVLAETGGAPKGDVASSSLDRSQVKAPAQWVPAADPRYRYEGRFDFTDSKGPVVVWEGSRISIDFTGTELAFRFGAADGQNFFDVHVDDSQAVLPVPAGASHTIACPLHLGAGSHRLMLFKRTEATAGTVRFEGIEIGASEGASMSKPPSYRRAMAFFGDSITAGACDEDGASDQWEDRRTHNSALSYATLTASALEADFQNISVSGIGVVTGWVPFREEKIWDRVYPRPDSAQADLAGWTPNVVFVNLGENDDSFTRAHGQPFPAEYATRYVELVQSLRRAYPAAWIVLLRGGMYGGSQSPELRAAWEDAVGQLEKSDAHVTHFVFQHWTKNHPRVSDHRAMADELIAWLQKQQFIAPQPPPAAAPATDDKAAH